VGNREATHRLNKANCLKRDRKPIKRKQIAEQLHLFGLSHPCRDSKTGYQRRFFNAGEITASLPYGVFFRKTPIEPHNFSWRAMENHRGGRTVCRFQSLQPCSNDYPLESKGGNPPSGQEMPD